MIDDTILTNDPLELREYIQTRYHALHTMGALEKYDLKVYLED